MIFCISNLFLHRRVNRLGSTWISFSFCVVLNVPFSPNRHSPEFNQVKIPGSSRSALVIKAVNNRAQINISRPSDCLFLQREDVHCSQVTQLTLYFHNDFINAINGPVEQQPPDTWKEALRHLLNTYRPRWCEMQTGNSDTGIEDGHKVQLADGTSYGAYWNQSHGILWNIK